MGKLGYHHFYRQEATLTLLLEPVHDLLSRRARKVTHTKDADQLKGYLIFGDVAAAENITHTLKDVAGSLGLIDIARNTEEIDQLLRQDNKADQVHRCLDHHVAILAEYHDFQLRRCHQ